MSKGREYLKEIQDMEQTIKRLKRQVDQLRKELRKRDDVSAIGKHDGDEGDEPIEPSKPVQLPTGPESCPNCGRRDKLKITKILNRTIKECEACKWRKTYIREKKEK